MYNILKISPPTIPNTENNTVKTPSHHIKKLIAHHQHTSLFWRKTSLRRPLEPLLQHSRNLSLLHMVFFELHKYIDMSFQHHQVQYKEVSLGNENKKKKQSARRFHHEERPLTFFARADWLTHTHTHTLTHTWWFRACYRIRSKP